MTSERIFNIFVYFDHGVAREYGVRHHRMAGTEEEKLRHLQSKIDGDHQSARRFKLDRSFSREEWMAALRFGSTLGYFEAAFQQFRAPIKPVYCLTPIVDGKPTFDQQVGHGPFRGDAVSAVEGAGAVPDYLVHYMDGNEFQFTRLINDDYFLAIKALFNEKLYVSSAKLLMSCVDTLAFVEFGDVQGNFARWLDTYVDLSPHNISSEELWEFRNSVLHMTNLASRKVVAGKVSPIAPYVGGPPTRAAAHPNLPKPFNLHGLITTIGNGIGKWGGTYSNPEKFLKFIERYDTTISDSRMAQFRFEGHGAPPRPEAT